MKRFVMVAIALATALAAAPAVKADSFDFSITGGNFTINGSKASVIGTPAASGYSVYSAGAGYNYNYNDIVHNSGAPLDDYGLLFQLGTGGVVNLWEVNGIFYWNEWVNGAWEFAPNVGEGGEPIDAIISATPEPSSLLLLGTGLLLLAGFAFRKTGHRAGKNQLIHAV